MSGSGKSTWKPAGIPWEIRHQNALYDGYEGSLEEFIELYKYSKALVLQMPAGFSVSPLSVNNFRVTPVLSGDKDKVSVLSTFEVWQIESGKKAAGVKRSSLSWLERMKKSIFREIERSPTTPHYDQILVRETALDTEIQRRRLESERPPPVLARKSLTDCRQRVLKGLAQGDGAILVTKFSIDFTAKDLRTLQPKAWLNDEVINFYMQMIMERSLARKHDLPSVHIFSTFFYPKLKARGYDAVRASTRKASPSVLSRDLVLFPIHLGMHWCMAAIRFRERSISYYDSLHGSNVECVSILRNWLAQESIDKLGKEFDFTDWQEECPTSIPVQQNSYDCGVFAIAFAECLSRNAPFEFSQRDMPMLRERIGAEILDGQLVD